MSDPIAEAVRRIRFWLVRSFRYTASTIELDEVLAREIGTATEQARQQAEQERDDARNALWVCGCGWTNGANLATCAQCGRTPIEGNALPYTSDAHRAHQRADKAEAELTALRATVTRLRAEIDDMQRASALVDEADGPQEYQTRLVALAMIARAYLRKLDAALGRADEPAE